MRAHRISLEERSHAAQATEASGFDKREVCLLMKNFLTLAFDGVLVLCTTGVATAQDNAQRPAKQVLQGIHGRRSIDQELDQSNKRAL
jgi:hypothetical protein